MKDLTLQTTQVESGLPAALRIIFLVLSNKEIEPSLFKLIHCTSCASSPGLHSPDSQCSSIICHDVMVEYFAFFVGNYNIYDLN